MSQVKIYKELDLTSAGCSGPIGELSSVAEELKSGEAVKVIVETVKSKMAPRRLLTCTGGVR